MERFITQIILGIVLLFGTATLLPRGIVLIRGGEPKRGIFYLFMAGICTFFSLMSFLFSYTVFKEIF